MTKIPYVDLASQSKEIMGQLLRKTQDILESGQYILGKEVSDFEQAFAKYCGTTYAVGVSDGTSALILTFKGLGIGPGDEVITVPNSFVASVSSIVLVGATPVLVDIGDDLNMDPVQLEKAITPRTKLILPVHLTGRLANMPKILEIARRHNLPVVEDSAQSVAANFQGKRAGSWGTAGTFSLHPLKNLHGFGDAGVVTTNDKSLYEYLLKARNHGFRDRDHCEFWSHNDRLDSLQAGYLNVQLPYLDAWTGERRKLAHFYNTSLADVVEVPKETEGEFHVYQTYVVKAMRRDDLLAYLQERGVDAKVHYPIPLHLQESAKTLGYGESDFPRTMAASKKIMSLPLFPGLKRTDQEHVIKTIRGFYAR